MAISCMRNASRHNYRNNSFTMDLAMGQIPRSTEHIPSLCCDSSVEHSTVKQTVWQSIYSQNDNNHNTSLMHVLKYPFTIIIIIIIIIII